MVSMRVSVVTSEACLGNPIDIGMFPMSVETISTRESCETFCTVMSTHETVFKLNASRKCVQLDSFPLKSSTKSLDVKRMTSD